MPAKQDNEITVKIKGSMEDFIANIKEKGFKLIEEFKMEDAYFIPKSLKLNEMTCREILAKAILVRYIENFTENIETKLITFKRKEIDKSGVILNQEIFDVKVENLEDAKKFLQAIGYEEIMQIYELDKVYEKEGFSFAIKDIKDGDNLIEVELSENNEKLNSIDKLKQTLNSYNIPIYTDNYFVKKAEVELEKELKNRKI